MAAGTIVTIPLIIMVLIFQRRIVSGLTAGGVKA
jgi:multiple sugar transport system permease protein